MSDAAAQAVRQHLALGVDLLGTNPLVRERDREEIVRRLARWRAESAIAEPVETFGLPAPFHVQQLDTLAVTMMAFAAPSDPVAWCACEILAAGFIEGEVMPPQPLRDFTVKVLRGDIQKPKIPSTFQNYFRDQMIAGAVDAAVLAGLNKLRNPTSEAVSACDVVAECLGDHGICLSADSVRKIYDQRRAAP